MLLMTESEGKKFDRDEAITLPSLSFEKTIPLAIISSVLYSIGGAIIDGHKCKIDLVFI
jgi:hypothetical protein